MPSPLDWLEGFGGVGLSMVLGAAAYLVQGAAELQAERRRAKLARIDAQLECLYGPLLAALTTSVAVFKLFAEERVGVTWPTGMPELMRRVVEDESLRAEYEMWMTVSILPQHDCAKRLLQEQAHLLEDSQMPQCMLDYAAMVAAYQVIRANWEAGDHTMLFSPLRMPPNLISHVRDTFDVLKRRQARLLEGEGDPVLSLVMRWAGCMSLLGGVGIGQQSAAPGHGASGGDSDGTHRAAGTDRPQQQQQQQHTHTLRLESKDFGSNRKIRHRFTFCDPATTQRPDTNQESIRRQSAMAALRSPPPRKSPRIPPSTMDDQDDIRASAERLLRRVSMVKNQRSRRGRGSLQASIRALREAHASMRDLENKAASASTPETLDESSEEPLTDVSEDEEAVETATEEAADRPPPPVVLLSPPQHQ